ncbi:MAG: serine hydrolase domain-containing protein [Myxococcota bacterium]|nr:serine hydrolase domain-containing protein [Myxococcota bacterium]
MIRLYALALLCCVANAGSATEVDLEALESTLEQELDAMRERDGFPGAMAAFALPDGRVGSAAVGFADPQRGIAMRRDHRSMSGSVGKTFAAALAVALALEGRLDLDAQIATWLADEPWLERVPNAARLTPRTLLHHTGGLEDHYDLTGYWLRAVWRRLSGGADAYLDVREQIACLFDRKPLFPAGTDFAYTDTGYLLLGLILERAGDDSYYEQIRIRFLEPLGLSLTSPSDRRDLPGLVAGHQTTTRLLPERTTDDEGRLRVNPANEWTGGGLVTNPVDLVRWAKALYEGRAPGIPDPSILFDDPVRVRDGVAAGLGVFVEEDSPFGPVWGHGGWFPGYSSQMRYFPGHRIAVAVQVNRGQGTADREYAMAVAGLVTEALGK